MRQETLDSLSILLSPGPVRPTSEPPPQRNASEPSDSRRHKRLLVLLLALGVGGYVMYANRRMPVGPQEGVGVSWPDQCQPSVQTRFRVATYNIHRGKGTDGVQDLGRTAKVLADADVVGLNEVAGPARPGQSDQAGRLGEELGIGWLFAPSQRRWHMYHFGNGLLSRLAVGRWTIEPLIHDKTAHSHRNVLTAKIMVGPQPVTVLITHIARSAIHPTQLRDVLTEFRKHTPAILIGDLNTKADHPLLLDFFADSDNVDAIGVALAEADSSERIDWIITRGMRVLAGGMEPTGVSDHPCYWVDVEVAGTTVDASTTAATSAER